MTTAVTWSSSDEGVATVSNASGSEGLASSVSVGSAAITALDPSSSVSDATTITITPAVPAYLDVTPYAPTLYTGTSLQFSATLYFSDGSTQDLTGSVNWSFSDTAVADVNSGFVNGFSAGTTTIDANDGVTGFNDSTTLTVSSPPSLMSISLSPTDPSIAHGSSLQFTAVGFYSDGSTQDLTSSVNWNSSDTAIADMNAGFVNGLSPGTVTITADDSGSGVNASTSLTVYVALSGISISPTDPTIAQGTNQQFTATGNYSDGSTQDITSSVSWSSSDTFIADVSNGYATGYNIGSVTISAYDSGSGVSGATNLYVSSPALSSISLSLSPTDPTITPGGNQQFSAIGNYSDGSTQDITSSVSWSSSDTFIADVSNGYATGYNAGAVAISAYDSGSGVSASTTLYVNAPPQLTSISLSPTDPTITQGGNQQFTATGYYSDGSTQDITGSVSWSSSNTSVADVSNGYATGYNGGSATIYAYDSGSGQSASTTLYVNSSVQLNSISLSPTDPTITQGSAIQFTATGNYSDGSTQDITSSVSWSSSDTFVADVSNGYSNGYNPGTVTISVYDSSSGQSASTTLTVQASVVLTSISLSPTDPTITQGDTLQFTAIGNYSDGSTQDITSSVSWSSSDTAIADVSSGFATSYGPGTVTISATDGGTGVNASTSLTVL